MFSRTINNIELRWEYYQCEFCYTQPNFPTTEGLALAQEIPIILGEYLNSLSRLTRQEIRDCLLKELYI